MNVEPKTAALADVGAIPATHPSPGRHERQITDLTRRLTARWPRVRVEIIEEFVRATSAAYDNSRIQLFIPNLIEHELHDLLHAHTVQQDRGRVQRHLTAATGSAG